MKIGVFSDVHGNLEALEKVIAEMEREGVERYWCLGDVVGYGANPNECAARVRQVAEKVVLGNHDAACVGAEEITHFNPRAQEAVRWTQSRLTPENADWLKRLPLTESADGDLLVHGSPYEPALWYYVHSRMRMSEMIEGFRSSQARAAFVGHSHQPLILVKRGEEFFRFLGYELTMEESSRYLINVGSVGQPRDGDPKACYAIYDPDGGTVRIVRVAYDLLTAQQKIRDAGLPPILAERLEAGM